MDPVRPAATFYPLTLDALGIAGYAVAGFYTLGTLNFIALTVIPMLAGLRLGAPLLELMTAPFAARPHYKGTTLTVSSGVLTLNKGVVIF